MKLGLIATTIILSLSLSPAQAATNKVNCKDTDIPTFIKKIEDYDIIANNTAKINTADAFRGKQLTYQIHYKVKNRENKVNINSKTGLLLIDAERTDSFDIKIIAKNACGSASTTFNVQIDEEE